MTDAQDKINEELPAEGGPTEIDLLKAQAEEHKNNWQRALADYRNLQKEIMAMRSQWAQMSEENILQNFIPVYENFKQAFSSLSPSSQAGVGGVAEDGTWQGWKQGIEYIMKQFGDVLKSYNVQEIKTVGEKFDPHWHEAVSALEPALNQDESGSGRIQGKIEPGTILKEVEGGYKMGDKVIKPARVIISK